MSHIFLFSFLYPIFQSKMSNFFQIAIAYHTDSIRTAANFARNRLCVKKKKTTVNNTVVLDHFATVGSSLFNIVRTTSAISSEF